MEQKQIGHVYTEETSENELTERFHYILWLETERGLLFGNPINILERKGWEKNRIIPILILLKERGAVVAERQESRLVFRISMPLTGKVHSLLWEEAVPTRFDDSGTRTLFREEGPSRIIAKKAYEFQLHWEEYLLWQKAEEKRWDLGEFIEAEGGDSLVLLLQMNKIGFRKGRVIITDPGDQVELEEPPPLPENEEDGTRGASLEKPRKGHEHGEKPIRLETGELVTRQSPEFFSEIHQTILSEAKNRGRKNGTSWELKIALGPFIRKRWGIKSTARTLFLLNEKGFVRCEKKGVWLIFEKPRIDTMS